MTLQSATTVFLVADVAATVLWYKKHLNFDADAVPPKPPHNFAILSKDEVSIMLQRLDGYQKPDLYTKREGGVWNVYVRMEGVREFYQKLSAIPEVKILEPLRRQPYGQTEFVIEDL